MLVASVPLGAKPCDYRNIVASGSNRSAPVLHDRIYKPLFSLLVGNFKTVAMGRKGLPGDQGKSLCTSNPEQCYPHDSSPYRNIFQSLKL